MNNMGRLLQRVRQLWRPSGYDDLQVSLTLVIFKNLAPTILVGSGAMIGATAWLANYYHDQWLWTLAGAMLLVCGACSATVIGFSLRREFALSSSSAYRWEWMYSLTVFLYSCTMAIATNYIYRYHDSAAWTLCMIGTFALCAAQSARLGMRPWLVQSNGIILLSALAFSILRVHQTFAAAGALLIFAYGYSHCVAARDRHSILVEQLRSRCRLSQLAEEDALTGLPNRRHFETCLDSICKLDVPFAVLYIDLDHFKEVNDTCGHKVGDTLLQLVAVRLKSAIRQSDLAARLGGDEFAILQSPLTASSPSLVLARRINQAIAEPFLIDGQQVHIGASIGIRLSLPGDKIPDLLLNKADQALYRVKLAGGGSFSFADC